MFTGKGNRLPYHLQIQIQIPVEERTTACLPLCRKVIAIAISPDNIVDRDEERATPQHACRPPALRLYLTSYFWDVPSILSREEGADDKGSKEHEYCD